MNENKFIIGLIFSALLFGGMVIGVLAGEDNGYRRGQLDYSAGKIEYTIQDGRTIQYLDGTK